MTSLSRKVALVTGASSGMGAASAARLEALGTVVVRTDLSGDPSTTWPLDVTDEASWQNTLRRIERQFGRLDILVNAAGVSLADDTFEACSPETWRKTMSVNVEGTFLGCKHAIPLMSRNGGGSIVNFGSVNSQVADGGAIAYVASKGAVRLLTRSVALHCAETRNGVRCNLVCPGYIETQMLKSWLGRQGADVRKNLEASTPMHRLGKPCEVANLVAWLASDEAQSATGGEFAVDGGFLAQ